MRRTQTELPVSDVSFRKISPRPLNFFATHAQNLTSALPTIFRARDSPLGGRKRKGQRFELRNCHYATNTRNFTRYSRRPGSARDIHFRRLLNDISPWQTHETYFRLSWRQWHTRETRLQRVEFVEITREKALESAHYALRVFIWPLISRFSMCRWLDVTLLVSTNHRILFKITLYIS